MALRLVRMWVYHYWMDGEYELKKGCSASRPRIIFGAFCPGYPLYFIASDHYVTVLHCAGLPSNLYDNGLFALLTGNVLGVDHILMSGGKKCDP